MHPWPNSTNSRFALGILVALAVALALRCPDLGVRPMHNDEAVNAIKFRDLYEHGAYKYDPVEYHGPTLEYFTLAWAKLTRAPSFNDFSEGRLRFVTILFGAGLILLLPLVADGLGRKAVFCAALLTAVSPAMVFYSQYYIHEMLLVFFTFLALSAGWRYFRSRRIGWALLAGAAIGLMQATKETFVLELAAAAIALTISVVWSRRFAGPKTAKTAGSEHPPLSGHAFAALVAWLVVAALFFTSFFTRAAGIPDSVRTYLPWLHRTAGASPHIHGVAFYLRRLVFFHIAPGPAWSEGLIIGLAIIGSVAAFAREAGGQPDSGDPRLLRFLAVYALALAVIYSALPYKTPWCALGFFHPMILLAGTGTVRLLHWARPRWLKIALGLLLLGGAGQLAVRAWQSGTVYSADHRNPYVYAQTAPDLLNLVKEIDAIASASSQGRQMIIKVMAPEGEYWPLPWYLRRFNHVGWWSEIPSDPYAPVMIVSAKMGAALDEKKTHIMAGYFKLRTNVFLELYVRRDLWEGYLQKRPKEDDAD